MREALLRTAPLAICVFIQMIAHGMMGTYFGIWASENGVNNQYIGFLGGVFSIGAIIAAAVAAKIILRIGHIRLFALCTALFTGSVILLDAWNNIFFWFALRFLYGFAITATFVISDSWFNHASKNEFRGKVMSIYMAATYAGIALGQYILYLMSDLDSHVILIVIGTFVSASSISILLTVQPTPPISNPKSMPLLSLWARVPVSIVTTLFLGMFLSNMSTMMPVYLTEKGLSLADIAFSMLLYQFGGFLGQYPMGYLSDKFDRRWIISSCMLLGFIGLFLIYCLFVFHIEFPYILSIAAFIIGFAIAPLYGVNCAHANDRLEEDEMVGAASTLVFVLAIGGLMGPLAAGSSMNALGEDSFLYILGVGTICLASYVFFRILVNPGVFDEESRGSYSVMPKNVTPITQLVAQEDTEEQKRGDWENENN